jgi:hypothetical protein
MTDFAFHKERAKKNRAKPGLSLISLELQQYWIAQTAAHLRQFGQCQFLNFNNGVNGSVHGNPLLQDMVRSITVASQTTLGGSFPWK